MNRVKNIIDGAWYAWPRFPGAVFHLTCSALASPSQLYCTITASQTGNYVFDGHLDLETDSSEQMSFVILNPYTKHPQLVGNNGASGLETLGTFSQHSIASAEKGLPYMLIQWGERVGNRDLDDKRRMNLIVWEPEEKRIRYIKTQDAYTVVYYGTCKEL